MLAPCTNAALARELQKIWMMITMMMMMMVMMSCGMLEVVQMLTMMMMFFDPMHVHLHHHRKNPF